MPHGSCVGPFIVSAEQDRLDRFRIGSISERKEESPPSNKGLVSLSSADQQEVREHDNIDET